LRRLDEWHKYVDIQVKRVSSAKTGQTDLPASRPPEIEDKESETAQDSGQGALLDDFYATDSYTTTSFLPSPAGATFDIDEDPLPDHLRPTPLPAMIEFAPSDLSLQSEPDQSDLQAQPEPIPSAALGSIPSESACGEMAIESREEDDLFSAAAEPLEGFPPMRNGRSGNGVARKETREELLARLLDPELTLEEAAQVLNVCPTTVRRYTNRGVLPHYRTIGNQRRFRLSQVLAFLETQEAPSRSQGLGNGQRNDAHAERTLKPTEEP
jgi:excisionase family DNA binding protein